jgi:hypothetical protein
MCRLMPSFSKIGTNSSMDFQKAASDVSVVPPAQQEVCPDPPGEGPRPNSEFMVSQPSSTAIWMAAFQ